MARIYTVSKNYEGQTEMQFDVQTVCMSLEQTIKLRNMLTDYINEQQDPVAQSLKGNSNSSLHIEQP